MPRPKVAPENRRRIQRACEACRTSKRRCDGAQPCRVCVRRGQLTTCVYAPQDAGQALPARTHRPALTTPAATGAATSRPPTVNDMPAFADGEFPSLEQQDAPSIAKIPDHPQSRMLYNSRGERVYVGNVSGLSFLNYLKRALRHHLGPSQFTNEPASEWMLETFDVDISAAPVQSDPVVKMELVECYFIATSGLLNMYTRTEILDYLQLDACATLPVGSVQSAALNIIIAIGSQSRMLAATDIEIAASGFNYGRNIAFREQLENPSVDLIRLFLLMAFYMVGACRRHAASMYVGVASMAASTLGLHATEQYSSLTPEESSLRWRTFRSLSTFDIIHASLLGRPCMTPATTAGMPQIPAEQIADTSGIFAATTATLEICHTIQDVLGKLNNGTLEIATAQRKCEILTGYGQMLKQKQPHLRATQHLLATSTGRAGVVGNVHASCTYYHALILVTRPSLIASLTTRLSPRPSPVASFTSGSDGSVQHLSEICIDSATHMAQTCYDAFTAGILLANMCLLKVWLFEAGLVLGFAMSVDAAGHSEAEDAYRNARKVLKTLSKTSSLAKEYYDILSSLLQAINMYRRQKAKQGHPQNRHSVGRLLEFDLGRPTSQSTDMAGVASALSSPEESSCGPTTTEFLSSSGDDFLGRDLNPGFDYGSEEWLQFANQVSGFLPMNNDSLGLFFNSI